MSFDGEWVHDHDENWEAFVDALNIQREGVLKVMKMAKPGLKITTEDDKVTICHVGKGGEVQSHGHTFNLKGDHEDLEMFEGHNFTVSTSNVDGVITITAKPKFEGGREFCMKAEMKGEEMHRSFRVGDVCAVRVFKRK